MAIFVHIVLFALSASLLVHDVSAWSFTPVLETIKLIEIPNYTNTVHFVCQADVPLVKCQINIIPGRIEKEYELFDLSQGSNSGVISRIDPYQIIDTMFHVSYNGTGLEHGQCGATFTNLNQFVNHFGCRGADEAGAWQTMDFLSGESSMSHGLDTTINHRQVVVLPGRHVSFLLKINATIGLCCIKIIARYRSYVFNNERTALRKSENKRYYGSSPSEGECGLTFLNVKNDENGPILLSGHISRFNVVERMSTLIVASPPPETYFHVDKMKYSVRDTLNATCWSLLSRPVANLTWTLDDRIIRQDMIDDEFQKDVWSWPWDKKNITQRMSITLEEEHFGKKLECSVQHLALTNKQSDFNYLITKV